MEIIQNEEDRYYQAKKRVEAIRGFYGNLTSYIVLNIFFFILNIVTSPEHLWFYWPLLGWGIGVLFHGMRVFNYSPFFGKDWEEKKLQQFLEEEKKKEQKWQ